MSRDHPLNRDALLECLRHCVRLRRAWTAHQSGRRRHDWNAADDAGVEHDTLGKIIDAQLADLVAGGLMNEGIFDQLHNKEKR